MGFTQGNVDKNLHVNLHKVYIITPYMVLTNLEELSLRKVLAFPKAENTNTRTLLIITGVL